jgi:hypothetical protein
MAAEQLTLIWTSELVSDGAGAVRLVARKPLSHMSRERAAAVIGCSAWTVSDLFRLGYLKGYKPGARALRSDGRASNAKLRLCSESVLMYKAAQERAAKEWQAVQR